MRNFLSTNSQATLILAASKTRKQRGASMLEYALLVALIAMIAIPSVRVLGQGVNLKFRDAQMSLAGESSLPCIDGSPGWPGCLGD